MMIIIDKQVKNKVKDLGLHDAEIHTIQCNYYEHIVELPLILHNSVKERVNALIKFEDVVYIDVSLSEPWGAGIYINEVIINENNEIISRLDNYVADNNIINLMILLNSGDKINIITKRIIYTEK